MTDPRNIAHDKKVQQEKKHRHEEVSPGADQSVQPGKKPHMAPKPEASPADEVVSDSSDTPSDGSGT